MTDDLLAAKIDTLTPHSARIWNCWMGGKDNFAADRQAGDAYVQSWPAFPPAAS